MVKVAFAATTGVGTVVVTGFGGHVGAGFASGCFVGATAFS